MSTEPTNEIDTDPGHANSVLYIVGGVLVGLLMIAGLVAFSSAKETQRANDKADQFIAALTKAGVAAPPSHDQVVRVLGDDGGATCDHPNKALNRAIFLSMLSNGAAGPGSRPVIADRRYFAGQLLIIQVYCPSALPRFQDFVDKLKSADVAG